MMTRFIITHEVDTGMSTCLPAGLDTANLQDISVVGKRWRIFLDTKTGQRHDCNEYAEQWDDEVRAECDYD